MEGRQQPVERQSPTDGRASGAPGRHTSKLAEAALERYGLQGARIAFLESKGRGKLLFRADAPPQGRSLLRLHERRVVGRTALRSEMLWLRSLISEARLNVPEPVPAADGSLVVRVGAEGTQESRLCVLLRWVSGMNKTSALTSEDLFSVGSHVARLHQHSEHYAFPEGFRRPHAYDWERVFGQKSPLWSKSEDVYSQSELKVFRNAAERIDRDLRELSKERDAFGLIHTDLTPENFVFHNGEAYVIDFDSCGWGHYLYDLAVTLSALEAYGERSAEMRAAFLEGYQRERLLPEGYQKYLGAFRAMRLVRRVSMVFDRGDPAGRPWGPKRFTKVLERIEKYMASDGGVKRMDLGSP